MLGKGEHELLLQFLSENEMVSTYLVVVLPNIGDIIAYKHGLHFCCQEVYPYRNQNKV